MPPAETILCAFDYSGASRSAVVRAADLAEREHAALHLLHVDPLFRAPRAHTGPAPAPEAAFLRRAHDFVDDVLGADGASAVVGPAVHELTGATPADGILHYADEIGADLIVVGTHGRRGLEHVILGSVAAETLRRSRVPVLVVSERATQTAPEPDAPVLAAVDLADPTPAVVEAARHLAEAYAAPLAAAYVREVPPATLVGHGMRPHAAEERMSRPEAHAALRTLLHDAGIDPEAVERYVVPGRPAFELVGLARRVRAGLVVLSTHGRRGWDRLRLGSVAEGVARQAPCAVLVVPTPQPGGGAPAASAEHTAAAP